MKLLEVSYPDEQRGANPLCADQIQSNKSRAMTNKNQQPKTKAEQQTFENKTDWSLE